MSDYEPKKHVVLVANGEPPSPKLLYSILTPRSSLIAIDGGFYACQNYQRLPELVLGDFDSLDQKLIHNYPTIQTKYLPDQEKSDLEKSIEYLMEFSPERIVVLGALGRRTDHTYKNLELLSRFPQVIYQTPYEQLFALPSKSTLSCGKGKRLSLIPFGGKVTKVESNGLKWELKGKDLNRMSLSNVSSRDQVSIEFERGTLLCALLSSS